MNPASELPRMTAHMRLVLLLMVREPARTWYGWEIVSRLRLLPGTVYPILYRFARAGWLTSSLEPAELVCFPGRRRRRLYRFTDGGLASGRETLSGGLTPACLAMAKAVDLPVDLSCPAP